MNAILEAPVVKKKKVREEKVRVHTHSVLPLADYDHIILCFSGGKDSVGCFLELLERGADKEKIELWHQRIDGDGERLMDWPCTDDYVRLFGEAFGVKVRFQWREGGFAGEMLRKDAPTSDVLYVNENGETIRLKTVNENKGTRLKFPQMSADLSVRWCSAALKIDVAARVICNEKRFLGKKILIVTGERREESTARSKYLESEHHRTHGKNGKRRHADHWRIVIDKTEAEVWDMLRRWRVRPHLAYILGFGRVSCMKCIFSNFDQWAASLSLDPTGVTKIASYETDFGVTIRRGLTVLDQAKRGEDFTADKPLDLKRKAMGLEPLTLNDVIVLDGEEWVLPAGAFKHCGGPI